MEPVKIASGQDGDTYYAYCTHSGHEYGAAFSKESEADAVRMLAEILGQRLVNINAAAMRTPIHRGLDNDTIILTPVKTLRPMQHPDISRRGMSWLQESGWMEPITLNPHMLTPLLDLPQRVIRGMLPKRYRLL